MKTLVTADDIRLVCTCGACPEQYDAFLGDEQVGYLRYRYGYFTVECPDCWDGETVYEAAHGDDLQGFGLPTHHLTRAKDAIARWVNNR